MARNVVTGAGIALIAALLLSAAAVGGPAFAGGLDDARSRGRLLVGVKTDFPPFGYLGPDGKPRGFDSDIARYLARALFEEEGRLELVPVTTGSRIPFLYSGWVDMIVATMTATEERRRVLDFSEPYFVSASLILVPEGSSIRGIEDLAGATVAVLKGSVQEKDLALVIPRAKRVTYQTVGEAVSALKEKRADALCQDEPLVRELAKRNKGFKIAGKAILPRPYVIAVRKGDRATLRWIDEKLSAMKNDGTYERLRAKYFGGAVGKEEPR